LERPGKQAAIVDSPFVIPENRENPIQVKAEALITMFAFFQKATPAIEVANALWIHGVSDSPETRLLAETASEENSLSDTIIFDEAVYFMSFATDLAIHTVFKNDARRNHALRKEFLDHVRGYARYQQCTPCPVGDWLPDISFWEIKSPGRDTGNPVKHLSDRFDLYAEAMRRPSDESQSLPAVLVLSALCETRDIRFLLSANMAFVDHLVNTQTLLREIRVKP
jgi:hypothetical protein